MGVTCWAAAEVTALAVVLAVTGAAVVVAVTGAAEVKVQGQLVMVMIC